jgi:hypothetical protein
VTHSDFWLVIKIIAGILLLTSTAAMIDLVFRRDAYSQADPMLEATSSM